jgi:hypothetical protein
MNEPYNCNENEKDKDNHGTNELGIREVIEHAVLLGFPRRQRLNGSGLGGRGRTYAESIMEGCARECWPELLTVWS